MHMMTLAFAVPLHLLSAWIFCRQPWICCKVGAWISLVIHHLEFLQLELALVDLTAVSGQVDTSDDAGYLWKRELDSFM